MESDLHQPDMTYLDSPDGSQNQTGTDLYFQTIRVMQEQVIKKERGLLQKIGGMMAESILNRKRIFLFGTGHSHMLVEEAYSRAGGLIPITPIFHSALMLHENVELSSRLERTLGLASLLLSGYKPEPGEMVFIFSNSGVNALPVEMALTAKDRGMLVISVGSLAYARVAPLSHFGKRLDEVSDYYLDNGGVPGDAIIPFDKAGFRAGPSSTLMGVLLWNCLVTETALRLQAATGVAPIFASSNMPGADAHNQNQLAYWSGDHTLLEGAAE